MARYPKRQKVKRYRRSFYTREMRLKKGIGIAVLVVAVLAAAWVAAPHVLDWATHTWYTVVRDRDLSASSAVSESASSGTQSTAASEPAASSVPEKEPEPEVKGTDIVTGLWAEVDVTTLTDEAAIRSAARQLKAQGMTYAILTLKDTAGQVYYASQTAVGAANAAPTQVELTSVASIFKEEGLVPVAALTAFRDPAGARADHALAIRYQGQEYLWLDNKASAGGNPWLNPYAAETVQYIGDLIAEVHAAGFDQVLLENVQFPSSTSAKQDYGAQRCRSCRAADCGYRRLAGPLRRYGDALVRLFAGRGDRLLQPAGSPCGPTGREEPAGEGPVLLYAGCSGPGGADPLPDRGRCGACGHPGRCRQLF